MFQKGVRVVASQVQKVDEKVQQVDEKVELLQRQLDSLRQNITSKSDSSPEELVIRSIFNWILLTGLDTTGELGMAPSVHFVPRPNHPANDIHVMIDMDMIVKMCVQLFKSQFSTGSVLSGLKTKLRNIKPQLGHKDWSAKEVEYCLNAFPTKILADCRRNIVIIELATFIRLLKREADYQAKNEKLLPSDVNLHLKHEYDASTGQYDITDIGDMNVKDKKKKSCLLMQPFTISKLYELATKALGIVSPDKLWNYIACRRFFGFEASREYLALASVREGIQAVRSALFGKNEILPADGTYELSADWSKLTLGVETKSMQEILSEILAVDDAKQEFLDFCSEEVAQRTDTDEEPADGRKKRKKRAPAKPKQKKPIGRPPKKPRQAAVKVTKNVFAEQPPPVTRGKGLPKPVFDEKEDADDADEEEEEQEEQEQEEEQQPTKAVVLLPVVEESEAPSQMCMQFDDEEPSQLQ